MLISFKVSNFLSFKEETEFSMVAVETVKEEDYPHHVIKGKRNQPNLLRAALLYGANAAGKSNFVRAIDYVKALMMNNSSTKFDYRRGWYRDYLLAENIFENQFRNNKKEGGKPSSFVFEFISNNSIYEYGFKINEKVIIEEWLADINKTPTTLFHRKFDKNYKTVFYKNNISHKDFDKEFLRFVQRSVIPTKLFLTHSVENNVPWFRDAFDWFQNSLRVIFPSTKFFGIEEKMKNDNNFCLFFTELLRRTGTGIKSIKVEEFQREKSLLRDIANTFTQVLTNESNEFVSEKGDKIEKFLKMSFIHDNDTEFERQEESDGTQRLFDLASFFYDLMNNETPKIYVIDELERRLHTNLSYMLLKSYLEQEGKGQLIATTHDTHLLDLDLLRRDEIWFAEKDEHGATQLYSLYDFNPRYDKKIEKEYLTGRFGAIPFLGNLEFKRRLAKNGKSKNNGES